MGVDHFWQQMAMDYLQNLVVQNVATFHAKRYRLKTDTNTKRKHRFFSVYLKFPFDHSDQDMFREAFGSPDHVQRTNVDCGCTVQVPAGRHPVRRLQAGGDTRK